MLRLSRIRRLGVLAASVAALAGGTSVAVAPAASASVAVHQVADAQTPYSFCNKPSGGATIGCFKANITFLGKKTYELTNIRVQDTLCDNRQVFADLYDSYGGWTGIEWAGPTACNETKTYPGPYKVTEDGSVESVYIALYACNNTSCSDVVYSGTRVNPFY